MGKSYSNESMLEVFVYETFQNIDLLETFMLIGEEEAGFSKEIIQEIYRVVQRIKESSFMMMMDQIALLAKALENLFEYIRDEYDGELDFDTISDLVMESTDFMKLELQKVKKAMPGNGDPYGLIKSIGCFLQYIKGIEGEEDCFSEKDSTPIQYYLSPDISGDPYTLRKYQVQLFFDIDNGLENIKAFTLVHHLKDMATELSHSPENLMDDESVAKIRNEGLSIVLWSRKSYGELYGFFSDTYFIKEFELKELQEKPFGPDAIGQQLVYKETKKDTSLNIFEPDGQPEYISNMEINDWYHLLTEAMETVASLGIMAGKNDQKKTIGAYESQALTRLGKSASKLQDRILALYTLPFSSILHRLHRVIKETNKKTNHNTELVILCDDIRLDKDILDPVAGLLENLIRETVEKADYTRITLQGVNRIGEAQLTMTITGDFAWPIPTDVTEWTGGKIKLGYIPGQGTGIMLTIPNQLTLIKGTYIRIGDVFYILPTNCIRNILQAESEDLIHTACGKEVLWLHHKEHRLLRLYKIFGADKGYRDLSDGVLLEIEDEGTHGCLFADRLLGERYVTVKVLPPYLQGTKEGEGFLGYTLDEEGRVVYVLDAKSLFSMSEALELKL